MEQPRRMTLRKTILPIIGIASTLCLAGGYAIAGLWMGAAAAIMAGFAWRLARKHSDTWLPSICLVASVGLAVVGRLMGSPPWLMIVGSGIALAVWDILSLDAMLERNGDGEQTKRYESKHLQSLALALGSGLFIAFLGRLVNLQTPFFLLMILIALAAIGLDRVWDYIKKRSMHIS
jgi:hypothetical protein